MAEKGTFWTSTAAILTAIGTLLAGIVALATFVVSQDWFGKSLPPGPAPSRIEVSNEIRSAPTELRFGQDGTIDLDPTKLDRGSPYNFSGNDIILNDDATVQGHALFVWEADSTPSASDCASYLNNASLSTRLNVDVGSKVCVWTSENRIALVEITQLENGWRVIATVWKQRMAA